MIASAKNIDVEAEPLLNLRHLLPHLVSLRVTWHFICSWLICGGLVIICARLSLPASARVGDDSSIFVPHGRLPLAQRQDLALQR